MTKTQSLLEFAEKHPSKRPTLADQIAPFLEEIREAREAGVSWDVIHKWLTETQGVKCGRGYLPQLVREAS